MLEVTYEGLVADPEAWTRAMLQFIDLPWDPRCLEFARTQRTVVTASKWQVRQAIDTSSVERWRNYERFLVSCPVSSWHISCDPLRYLSPWRYRNGARSTEG